MNLIQEIGVTRRFVLATGGALAALSAIRISPMGDFMATAAHAQARAPLPGSGKWVATTCQGCTAWCPKQAYVQNGRVIHIRGNEYCANIGTSGCVRQYLSIPELYDQDRVKTPMKRTNPKKGRGEDPGFVPITWDEAMDTWADAIMKLREKAEPHKYMTLRGRYGGLNAILMSRMTQIIGSPNAITHSAICAEADKFGPLYLEGYWGYRQYDMDKTRYTLAFGTDPITSNRSVSYSTKMWGQMSDNGRITVVDPRLSPSAAKADTWLPIKNGTDSALALALAHVILAEGLWYKPFVGDFVDGQNRFVPGQTVPGRISVAAAEPAEGEERQPDRITESFNEIHTNGVVAWWNLELKDRTPEWAAEITEIPAEQIVQVAREMAAAAPSVAIWMSRGTHMTRKGAYASMAMHALSGLLGAADNEGGTLQATGSPKTGTPAANDYLDELAAKHSKFEKIDRRGRLEFPALKDGKSGGGVVSNQPADSILEEDPYMIEVMLMYYSNFAFSCPGADRWEKALAKVPMVVHLTTNISEASWFSDIVLPASHNMYERWNFMDNRAGGKAFASIQQPMVEPLNGGVQDETGVPWLLAEALARKGFDAPLRYLTEQFADPETGAAPSNHEDFSLIAVKMATQPQWDPEKYVRGDKINGWAEYVERGVWNGPGYAYRKRWSNMKTETKKFEFYSESLKKALTAHAEKHGVSIDEVMEATNYDARGDLAFIAHWEEPYRYGDEAEYPLLFQDHKSKLTREGRGSNPEWFQANKDVDPGDLKWSDAVKINPADAERFGIAHGDKVRLTPVAGSIECYASLWEGVRPGTVAKTFAQGHWAYGRHSAEIFGKVARGGNNNDIIPVDYDRLSGSTVFAGQIGVRVEKV